MAKCEYCGIEIELPFKCNYCGRYFCEAHRLLESHDCQNAPIRTPLGSLQSKQSLAENARKKELEIASENASFSDQSRTEAVTHAIFTVIASTFLSRFIQIRNIAKS